MKFGMSCLKEKREPSCTSVGDSRTLLKGLKWISTLTSHIYRTIWLKFGLFDNVVLSCSVEKWGDQRNINGKGCGRKWSWPDFMYYSCMFLGVMEDKQKNPQYSVPPEIQTMWEEVVVAWFYVLPLYVLGSDGGKAAEPSVQGPSWDSNPAHRSFIA